MKSKRITIKCDFCKEPAAYDTKTIMGPWANVCHTHFERYSVKQEGLYSRVNLHEDECVETTWKVCSWCGESYPLCDYYTYTDGRGTKRFRTECKNCNQLNRKLNAIRKTLGK